MKPKPRKRTKRPEKRTSQTFTSSHFEPVKYSWDGKAWRSVKKDKSTSGRVAKRASFLLRLCDEGAFVWVGRDGSIIGVTDHVQAVAGSALVQKTKGKRRARR